MAEDTKPKKKKLPLVIVGVVVLVCVVCGIFSTIQNSTPEGKATATARALERTAEASKPTATAKPTNTPKPANTPMPPTATPKKEVMYVCGYDRCTVSGAYGELVLTEGINVWSGPDPNRGAVHHQVKHGQKVVVIEIKSVDNRTWYRLEDGGWLSDLWLTKQPCTQENLEEYSLDDC